MAIPIFRSSIYVSDFTPFSRMKTAWILFAFALLALLTVSVAGRPGARLRKVSVNIPLLSLYIAFAAWAIIASFMHRLYVGMRPNILVSVLMIGLYYIWIRSDIYKLIITRLSRVMLAAVACFALLSLCKIPPETWRLFSGDPAARYVGLTANPNNMGALMAGAVMCGVFLISCDTVRWRVAAIPLSVLCAGVLLLTESRTALFAASAVVLLGIIAGTRQLMRKRRGSHRRAAIIAVALLFAALSTAGIVMIVKLRGANLAPDGRTDWFAFFNTISSGRAEIWREAFGRLALWGVDPIANPLYYNGEEMLDTHNIALTYAYSCGIGAGLAYLLFELCAVGAALKRAFSRTAADAASLFALLCVASFFLYSLFEVNIDFVRFPYMLLFAVGVAPVFFRPVRNKPS
ncbi:MAG: hypothetical protein LBC58_06655 [Clostridiales Family XIII bacterium]|nr:hypothetical protein [Clostridiales Family XIII bacterium]